MGKKFATGMTYSTSTPPVLTSSRSLEKDSTTVNPTQENIVNKQNSPPIKTSGYELRYLVTQEKLNMTALLAVCAILFLFMKFRLVRRSSSPSSTPEKAPGTRGLGKNDARSETEDKKPATEASVPDTEGMGIEEAPGKDHEYGNIAIVTHSISKKETGETGAMDRRDKPANVEEETIFDEICPVMSLSELEEM